MNDLLHFFSDTRERCIHKPSFLYGMWFGTTLACAVNTLFAHSAAERVGCLVAFLISAITARLFWYLSPVR